MRRLVLLDASLWVAVLRMDFLEFLPRRLPQVQAEHACTFHLVFPVNQRSSHNFILTESATALQEVAVTHRDVR